MSESDDKNVNRHYALDRRTIMPDRVDALYSVAIMLIDHATAIKLLFLFQNHI